jgi:hypothetical protein
MLRLNTFASGPGFEPLLGPQLFFPHIYICALLSFDQISANPTPNLTIGDASGIVRNQRLRYCYATRARHAKSVYIRHYATVDRKQQQSKFPLDGAYGPQR